MYNLYVWSSSLKSDMWCSPFDCQAFKWAVANQRVRKVWQVGLCVSHATIIKHCWAVDKCVDPDSLHYTVGCSPVQLGLFCSILKLCLERLAASLHTTHCDWWHLGDLAPSPQKLQRKRHCCSGEINTCRQITCCSRETALGHFIFLRHHKVRIMCVLC